MSPNEMSKMHVNPDWRRGARARWIAAAVLTAGGFGLSFVRPDTEHTGPRQDEGAPGAEEVSAAGADRLALPEVLRNYREDMEARLHGYGWVDREQGIARIPIEEAIVLTAERGLPARGAGEGSGQ